MNLCGSETGGGGSGIGPSPWLVSGRLTPHDIRHTAASLAIASGASVKGVQRLLGHKDAAMTLNVYASLFEDDLDTVSDRLDAAISAAGAASVRPEAPAQVVDLAERQQRNTG